MSDIDYYCTEGAGCHGRGEQSAECPACDPKRTSNDAISSLPPSPPEQPQGATVNMIDFFNGVPEAVDAVASGILKRAELPPGQPEGCELPPLPVPHCSDVKPDLQGFFDYFIADQMKAHAAAAYAMGRASAVRDYVSLNDAALAARQAPAEPNQDAADAARYRWWRVFMDQNDIDLPECVAGAATAAELDAAIDAVIAQEKAK